MTPSSATLCKDHNHPVCYLTTAVSLHSMVVPSLFSPQASVRYRFPDDAPLVYLHIKMFYKAPTLLTTAMQQV